MAVRLLGPIPNLVQGEWDEKRRDLVEFLRVFVGSISG